MAALSVVAMAALPLGGAAQARVPDEAQVIDSPDGPNTDIVFTSTGPGQSISGGQPAAAITPDPTAAYPASPPAGYTGISTFAGILNTASATDPSQTAQMFCINIRVQTQPGIGYENGTWAESNVPNIGYVAYILNNYYPAVPGEPADLATEDARAAAVQAAIWYFTDGFVLDAGSPVRAATAGIIAAAQAAGPLPEPAPPAVSITPTEGSAPEGSLAGPFTVTTSAASVTLSVPTGYTMYGDAVGTTPLANPYTTTAGTQVWVGGSDTGDDPDTALSARAEVTVQAGRVYLYDGLAPGITDAQRLILADTAVLDATAQAEVEFFAIASLTVDKAFAGDAVGQQGAIELVVDCGDRVPRTASIPAGATATQTTTFEGIAVGATCVVTEPTTGETTAVTVTTDAPQSVPIPEAGATATITNTVTLRPADAPGVLPATGTETPLPLLGGGIAGLLVGSLLVAASLTPRKPAATSPRDR